MSLKFLNGEISEDDYRKILPDLLKEAAKTNQGKSILYRVEDLPIDSLERSLNYNCVLKYRFTFRNNEILEETKTFAIQIESNSDHPEEIPYNGPEPIVRLTYNDFVNSLKKDDLKKLAENLAKLGF